MASVETIRAQLTRLLVLRNPPGDDLSAWETALVDVPDDLIAAAADHALKTRVFFPVPAEVRADADAAGFYLHNPMFSDGAIRDDSHALPQPFDITIPIPGRPPVVIHVVRSWRVECDDCGDSGWAEFWCGPRGETLPGQSPWLPVVPCPRDEGHTPHAYVRRCDCIPTNRTIQRRAEAQQRRYAREPETAGRARRR